MNNRNEAYKLGLTGHTTRRKFNLVIAASGILTISSEAKAQSGVKRGGTLTVGLLLLPKSMDPLFGDAISVDNLVYEAVYDCLVKWEASGQYGPGLAESWVYGANGRSLMLKLRQGVRFHDGTPFNAAAAVINLRRLISTDVNSPRASLVEEISSVDFIDSYTIRINLLTPSGALLGALATAPGMIVSPAALEKYGKDISRNPVGTGPFKFVEWPSGGSLKLARNQDYWRTGLDGRSLPYLDGLIMRDIPNSAVKLLEVESGNIQLIDEIVPRNFSKVRQNTKMDLVKVNNGTCQWIVFNITKAPFDNEVIRKAILFAIDREQMVKVVAENEGEVLPAHVTRNEWAFEGDIDIYKYNLQRSRELLAIAGKPNGFQATLTYIQRDPDTTVAQLLKSQLMKVGIDLKLEALERQAFIAKNTSKQHEISMGGARVPVGDPDQMFTTYFGDSAYHRGGAGLPEMFKLVDAGRQATVQSERKKIYRKAQELLLEKALYGWLFYRPSAYVKLKSVQNLKVNPIGTWSLEDVWLN